MKTQPPTPTPWVVRQGVSLGRRPYFVGETLDGKHTPFQSTKEANAVFIVRAINNYELLVKALKAVYDTVPVTEENGRALLLVHEAITKVEGKGA